MIPLLASAAVLGLLSQTPTPPASIAPAATANPFTHLWSNLGDDLKALGSKDTVWIASFGGVTSLVVHSQNDERLHTWVTQQPAAASAFSAGNFLGDGYVQGGGAIAAWLLGRSTASAKLEATGADLIRAQILNGLLTQSIKIGTQRTRPDGGGHSFPSGHTSATFATAAVIQSDYGAAASLPFYALGGFVGWSRIRTNHHWLSDTIAGAALGIISGRAATRHHPSKWTVTPVKTRGGAALFFIRR